MTKWQLYALDHLLDDHYALWDFADGLPYFRPDAESSRYSELVELIRLELVSITFGLWHKNQTVAVEKELAIGALSDPQLWQSTNGQPGYVIELTEAGHEKLKSYGFGVPKAN